MAPAYCQAHRSQLKSGTGAGSIVLITLQLNNHNTSYVTLLSSVHLHVPWNISQDTCIFFLVYIQAFRPVFQENSSDKRDIPWHIP